MAITGQGLRTAWRWIAGTVAVLSLLAALAVGAFRLTIELLPGYEERIAAQIRDASGLRLSFDSLDARLGRYGPEVYFRGAQVLPAEGDTPLVSAEAGRASLAIGRSFIYRRLEIGRIVLERPQLQFVVREDGAIELVGQSAIPQQASDGRTPMSLARLPRGLFEIRDATMAVQDLRSRPGRFKLTGVDLELQRSSGALRLHGRVVLPRHLGSIVTIDASAEGRLENPATLAWQGRIEARALDLEQWAALLPDTFDVPQAGRGSLRASINGVGRKILAAQLRPEFTGLRLADGSSFTRIAGDLRLRVEAGMIALDARNLELSREGAPWRPTRLELKLARRDGHLDSVSVRADYLRIENLAAMATLLPAGGPRGMIQALEPRGEIRDLELLVAGTGNGRVPDVTGRLRFSDLGFEPLGQAPGLLGLDGSVEALGAGGVIELAASGATVSWPLQWRAIAELSRAEGRIEWRRFGDGLRLWLDNAVVDTGHGIARGQLRMLIRRDEPPLINLQAQVSDADLTQIWRYLPIARMPPKSLAWLDAALRAGRLTEGSVSIAGPSRGFPYRDGEGSFHAMAQLAGATLYYAVGWPELRGVDATVEFEGPGLRVIAGRGQVAGIALGAAEASSADLREAIIDVRARLQGDAGPVIRLLQESPLAAGLGERFAELKGSGALTGELALQLPLKRFDEKIVSVSATLDGVTLQYGRQPLILSGLAGSLSIRNREIQAPELNGQLLGGPARLSVETRTQPDGSLRTRVGGEGTLTAEQLSPVARLPVNAGVTGQARWRGLLTLERSASGEQPARGRLRLSSDLRGLGSRLPAPFAKSAGSARRISVELEFGGLTATRVEARLGRDVHALLQWRRDPRDPPVERGILHFGDQPPDSLPPAQGLWLSGRLDTLSLSDLLALEWDQPRGRRLHEWLGGADLAVRSLEVLGYEFEGVGGRMRPGNRAWDIDVQSRDATGRIVLPHDFPGEVPMVLDLQRLRVGERVRSSSGEPDPRNLPAIIVDIRELLFDGRQFGQLQAELSRGTAGVTLNRFSIRHQAFNASGRGSWLLGERSQVETRLEFELDSADVGAFMSAMNFGTLVTGRHGHVTARLRWPGAPEATAIERMSGSLEIAAEDGRLTSVEPGAGRVFGLMSLAHLPRRLALDFGDLTGEGLAFDIMKGSFQLTDGEAYTDNLTLSGSAAEIGLAGRTSLRHRTYDQTAVVTGQLGASLGVAGALAGGPVVGAALLLFSQVFKGPLQGITRGYYRITGSWDEPQVRRIDASETRQPAEAAAARSETAR